MSIDERAVAIEQLLRVVRALGWVEVKRELEPGRTVVTIERPVGR